MGVCASSGGMFNNYAIVQGVDHIVPVDIYLPGCPPRPEMLLDSIIKLHDKIMNTKLGVNRDRQITELENARLGLSPLHLASPGASCERTRPYAQARPGRRRPRARRRRKVRCLRPARAAPARRTATSRRDPGRGAAN